MLIIPSFLLSSKNRFYCSQEGIKLFESFDLASENSSTRRQPSGIQLKSPQSSPSMRSYDLGNGVELRKPKLGRVG